MADLPETFVPGFHDENAVRKMEYRDLGNTGMKVSKLSFGTGVFSYFYGDGTLEEWKQTLHAAIKSGVNFIDTAPWYGHGESEKALGKCLEGIPRKAYYMATKVGRYEKDVKGRFDFTAKKVKESIDTSLSRMKLDYVDLLQVHDVEFAPSIDMVVNETLPAVEEILKSGKAKHIGITGYPISTLVEVLSKSKTKIETVLSYTRLTLIDHTLNDFIPLFQSKNLGLINAAVNAMGLLSSYGQPDWHPAQQHIKDVCTEARNYCKENNVELGKLAVYYSLQQPGPHTTLVGMNNLKVLNHNLDVLHSGITEKEKGVLDYLQNNVFSKLEKNCNWENVELIEYRKQMQS